MNILFRGGTVVTAEAMYRADVLVRGEKIAAVGLGMPAGGAHVVDVTGKYLLPGAIDAHTHLAGIPPSAWCPAPAMMPSTPRTYCPPR